MFRLTIPVEEVIERWSNGETYVQIAKDANVTAAWISKLIHKHVPARERLAREQKSRTPVREFTGANLDEGLKEALRQYTKSIDTSMSDFIAVAVEERLKFLGVPIHRKPEYKGEPLPLEVE